MKKEIYHHGDLKRDLIEKGLNIVNTHGSSALTMRKVAAECNVSATAAYKHFKNKDDLLEAIRLTILQDFADYLSMCLVRSEPAGSMLEIGKGYVRYMTEHKEYYDFMFCSELMLEVSYEKGNFSYPDNSPFGVFYKAAEEFLKIRVPDTMIRRNKILLMWSEVHGLAGLLCNGVLKTNDDLDELVTDMLLSAAC